MRGWDKGLGVEHLQGQKEIAEAQINAGRVVAVAVREIHSR